MNQMRDGCLIEVKTKGELSLGWPKVASFYVLLLLEISFGSFQKVVFSWKYSTLFSIIKLTFRGEHFLWEKLGRIFLGGTPFHCMTIKICKFKN